VKEDYFDPKMAQQIADALQAHEKHGDDDVVANKAGLAIALTRQMQQVSHDRRLEVVYSREVLPSGPREPTPEMLARFRAELEQNNCTFEQVKILPHNIGYLKLNAFPDVSICQSRAAAAMASMNHVNALIFDLRDNRGGSGQMVSLLASYLFDHPEFLYDPRTNPTLQSWTQPVPGNRLADKPVYVLTSSSTISAAEQFAYDLKALKRVTIVGETTRGSAHAGVFHRLDDHFGIGIPRLRAINPFSDEDWEGTGIAPDVKVKSANALEVAEQLAVRKLKAK
jgi:C-terminal processing protease CtpA/Prc